MNREFIPYEQAIKLLGLGFNEPCHAYYESDGRLVYSAITNTNSFWAERSIVSAPLYQQAFRWFRDKKLSDACVCRYQNRDDGGIFYYYCINHDFGIEETKHFKEGFFSYEEAELACLNKLIEIIKNK